MNFTFSKRFEVMSNNLVKRKKLADDYNRFRSIIRTSVILSSVLENWSNAESFHMRSCKNKHGGISF